VPSVVFEGVGTGEHDLTVAVIVSHDQLQTEQVSLEFAI